MKAIPTQQDVWKAWATLFRWNGGEARLKADYHLVKAWYPRLDGLGADAPGMKQTLELLRAPGENRTPWGYFLVLMLLVTQSRGDAHGYWRVACTLLELARQADRRSRRPPGGDPLSEWLKGYCEEHPAATPEEIYADVMRMCSHSWGRFEARDGGGVTFTPEDTAAAMIDIEMEALKKRIRRIRTSTG